MRKSLVLVDYFVLPEECVLFTEFVDFEYLFYARDFFVHVFCSWCLWFFIFWGASLTRASFEFSSTHSRIVFLSVFYFFFEISKINLSFFF